VLTDRKPPPETVAPKNLFERNSFLSDPIQFVTLQLAMAELDVSDQSDFVRTAQRHGCLLKRGGITRINLSELKRLIDEDFLEAQERVAKRREAPTTAGKQIGLVRARLAQYDTRVTKKQVKIAAAAKVVANAKNRYERMKAEADVAKLRSELDNLKAGQERDEQLLEELLNGPETESSA
jgi:hypothetical protein